MHSTHSLWRKTCKVILKLWFLVKIIIYHLFDFPNQVLSVAWTPGEKQGNSQNSQTYGRECTHGAIILKFITVFV